ncbi:hypothetical protein SAMN04488072_10917 [Lentibacillus halodurans]|uniref:Uncharacterized protein n=1 Tax=Lentibacillus halodurans TaxID=237679 RepID=A0A1I0Z219_9BACI|nr:hypothetical protein [Lentibacillus halodurans]SFB18323.1 hypothetical protein SAMN04488072_10917 [Lentibacillus halodurans]
MKKRYIASAAGAIGAGAAGYILRNGENRHQFKTKVKTAARKIRDRYNGHEVDSTFEDAGAPDQAGKQDVAQLENAKMVSEGSQFGVEYYNQVKEEKNEKMNI